MKAGPRCFAMIRARESLRLVAYLDKAKGGVWTLGYGRTEGVKEGDRCTEAEAEAWLQADVAWRAAEISRLVTRPLKQSQFDAVLSLFYNAGIAAFASSTMLRFLNNGDTLGAAMEFQRWSIDDGVRVKGLLRRRFMEALLFLED